MAKITIGGTGTVDDKNKQPTTTTTTTGNGIKPNLPTLPAGNKDSVMTNTDGGGAAVPKTETPAAPATGGGTGTKTETPTTTVTFGTGSYRPATTTTTTQQAQQNTVNQAEKNAETALADLKNQYSERLRSQYDYAADKMKAERDEALRENWVLQQQAEAALPEQMAARGVTGGATETSLANLIAKYQGNRNDIRGNYMNEMGDLAQSHNEKQAEVDRSYNEQWIDYLMYLAKLEEEHKKNMELAAAK